MYSDFLSSGDPYFPPWVQANASLSQQANIRFRPDATAVTYHWPGGSNPIFVPHPDDDGLLWDMLRWTENPE
jgi:hypothetical protein